MKVGQKISVWCIYFGFFIISSNNIHIQWYCYPTPFPHHNKDIYHTAGWAFLFPFARSLVFFLITLSKYAAAKILHGNEFTLYNHDQCRILNYKLIHHIQWFSGCFFFSCACACACVCVCVCVQKQKHNACTHSEPKIIFMSHEIRCIF